MQSIVAESNAFNELMMGPNGCRRDIRIMSDGSILKKYNHGWEQWAYLCKGETFIHCINSMSHRIFIVHNHSLLDTIPRKKD